MRRIGSFMGIGIYQDASMPPNTGELRTEDGRRVRLVVENVSISTNNEVRGDGGGHG